MVEGTEVSYQLDEDNSKLIITLVNGDKEQTLEAEVNIEHPLVVPNKNITIDVYKGYDIKDLITVDEDTVIEESLDEEKGILTILPSMVINKKQLKYKLRLKIAIHSHVIV